MNSQSSGPIIIVCGRCVLTCVSAEKCCPCAVWVTAPRPFACPTAPSRCHALPNPDPPCMRDICWHWSVLELLLLHKMMIHEYILRGNHHYPASEACQFLPRQVARSDPIICFRPGPLSLYSPFFLFPVRLTGGFKDPMEALAAAAAAKIS